MKLPTVLTQLVLLPALASILLSPRSGAAVTDDLEVYLPFDGDLEPGLTTDVAGVPTPASRPPRFVEGVFGEAASFINDNSSNGIGDWVVSLGQIDPFYTRSFTIGFWFKTGMRVSGGLLTGNSRMWTGLGWWISADPSRQIGVGTASAERLVAIPGFSDGRWHHLALIVDRETQRITVLFDGEIVHSAHSVPSGNPNTGLSTLIGASGDGAYGANADIDDYAIWSRALTADEVALLHGAGLRGRSLVAAENPELTFIRTLPRPNADGVAPDTAIATTIHPGDDPLDPASVTLLVDGRPVEAAVSMENGILSVTHQPSELLIPGSTHSVQVTADDGNDPKTTYNHEWSFEVSVYTLFTGTDAAPQAVGGDRGFQVRTVWASTASRQLAFSLERAHAQLNGTLIDPATGEPFPNNARPGPNPDESWHETRVINYNDLGSGAGGFPVDVRFPGFAGVNNPDNFSVSVTGALPLEPGFHRFGINADDGFEIRFGTLPRDRFLSKTAAAFDDGQATRDQFFDVFVTEPGIYPYQLILFEAGGRAALEFFSVDLKTGATTLINDPNIPDAIPSYAALSGWERPPAIRAAAPAPDTLNVHPDAGISVEIVDGTAELDPDLVTLQLDGIDIPASIRRDGSVTFVSYQPPATMIHGSRHTASVAFNVGSHSRVQSWQFAITGPPSAPAVTGHWDFARGDLSAVIGQPLRYLDEEHGATAARTQFGKASEFGINGMEGDDLSVMRFDGATHELMGFRMAHGATDAEGKSLVSRWTLILDILVPNRHRETRLALAQLDSPLNQDGADLYIAWARRVPQTSMVGTVSVGFQGSGSSRVLLSGEWHRLAFVADIDSRRPFSAYVDGGFVRSFQWDPALLALSPEILLFSDLFGASQEVYLDSVQFRNYGMTLAEIGELGRPSAAGIPGAETPSFQPMLSISSTDGVITLSWPAEAEGMILERANRVHDAPWNPVPDVTGTRHSLPTGSAPMFFRLRQ